jgi:hypothetical protein
MAGVGNSFKKKFTFLVDFKNGVCAQKIYTEIIKNKLVLAIVYCAD